ncbi:MAG: acyltransferase family protein, partial [Myxococcales bacterium]
MIVSVQVARAVAALMVVTWHFSAVYNDILPRGTSLGTPAFLQFGYAGVDLFFVISGFIISLITDKDDFRFSEFMVRRAIRILPFYALFTGV